MPYHIFHVAPNPTTSKHSIYFRTFAGVLEILRLQEFAFDVKRGLFERMRVDPFRISFSQNHVILEFQRDETVQK